MNEQVPQPTATDTFQANPAEYLNQYSDAIADAAQAEVMA